MKAFDFFCGAGGLSRGLTAAGFQVLAGFDVDVLCRDTYERNNPGCHFVPIDIRNLSLAQLITHASTENFSSMLFAGCAPCQPFSQQVKNGQSKYDATLLASFGRLIEEAVPGYILMENVPGIAKVKGYSTFKRFLTLLERNGYQYVYDIVDAKKFGVPQTRKRLVLLASRFILPTLPKAIYGSDGKPFRTVRSAISHFPPIKAGQKHSNIANHSAASLTELNLERLRHTPLNGGDRRVWPIHLRLRCHSNGYKGHTDVYGRMAWDAPAPTLTARCHSLSNGRYGHPTQDRAISLREAAALQSFPDDYIFCGSNKHVAQQIGNAVPPCLGSVLGEHIFKLSKPLMAVKNRLVTSSVCSHQANRAKKKTLCPH